MPGFVKTPPYGQEASDAHLISAEEAAREIVSGLRAGRFEIHFPRRFTCQVEAPAAVAVSPLFSLSERQPGCDEWKRMSAMKQTGKNGPLAAGRGDCRQGGVPARG